MGCVYSILSQSKTTIGVSFVTNIYAFPRELIGGIELACEVLWRAQQFEIE